MHTPHADDPFTVSTQYAQAVEGGKLRCTVCPRHCQLKDGQRGMCFVRQRKGDEIVLTTWGRSSGFCIDPIEKKPLNHFLPGSPVLSFGTAGCNLACKFCQNWDISKSRQMDSLADRADPELLARVCEELDIRSIAFTYNDPVIFLEYAVDVAQACAERDIKAVAVTAGYINEEPRREFFAHMDAANIDLKAFSEDFYRKVTASQLQPVLETLEYLYHQTDVWFEITTLLIPDENDSTEELEAMTQWIAEHLGPEVPLHFSAFHPDYRMLETERTPLATLQRARQIAKQAGLQHVYTGNVHDEEGDTTFCAHCQKPLIVRDWYELHRFELTPHGHCPHCQTPLAGRFDPQPGDWGRKRQRVQLNNWR